MFLAVGHATYSGRGLSKGWAGSASSRMTNRMLPAVRYAIGEPRLHDDLLAVAGRVEPDGGWIDVDGERLGCLQASSRACEESQAGNDSQRLRSHQRPSFFSTAAPSVGEGFGEDFG
jgi:hypothetical protein